tara:strand:- start:1694 stop:1855 length:162 start_codon:yes stop_codon:yes gene_type:complete
MKNKIKKMKFNQQEYKEMYKEFYLEGNFQPSAKGFREFLDWRKNVEALFSNKD